MFAIAEFGSICRSASDNMSDRDLLIVSPLAHRYELYEKYSHLGYSVTSLTEERLRRMRDKGSLFIQHLKHEARILTDESNRLRALLDSSYLIAPSAAELRRCEASLAFVSSWPEWDVLSGWKADFLFCVSRDYFIKRLAASGHLAFGLETIQRKAENFLGFTENSFSTFYRLREIKSTYRRGGPIPVDCRNVTTTWIKTLHSVLRVPAPNYKQFDVHSIPTRVFNSSYERLRTLEACYLLVQSLGLVHVHDEDIVRHVTCPNLYSSCGVKKAGLINKYISELVSVLANAKWGGKTARYRALAV